MDDEAEKKVPFGDYVHSSTDEAITNAVAGLNKKIDIPSDVANNKSLVFNASTNRFEASLIPLAGIVAGTNGTFLNTSGGVPTWVDTGTTVSAVAGSSLTPLTTTLQQIPNTRITLSKGTWLVIAGFNLAVTVVSAGVLARMRVTGITATVAFTIPALYDCRTLINRVQQPVYAIVTATAGQTVELQADISGAGPTASIGGGNTETGIIAVKLTTT